MGHFSTRSKRSSHTGSDVVGGSEDDSVMVEDTAKKRSKELSKTHQNMFPS